MKLTIDSNDSLQDVMRVLGALYGVTLVLSEDEADGGPARQRTTKTGTRAAATKPAAQAAADASSNAEVRDWARGAGLTVKERGRLPASVLTAYHDAHNGKRKARR